MENKKDGEDGDGREGERSKEEEEEEDKSENGKWNKMCPAFGVKSYHHQFYLPQQVKNPDLYEFPQMNIVYPEEIDTDKGNGYGHVFVVIILAGLLMSIISGVTLSLQYLAPCLWQQITEEFEAMEMWTLSCFLAGVLIILFALLVRLVIIFKESTRMRNCISGLCQRENDSNQAPRLQGNIPLIKEIQAIQPPCDPIPSTSMQ